MLLVALIASGGCALLDIVPSRDPLETQWTAWMQTAHFAAARNGREYPLAEFAAPLALRDLIASYPVGASFTTHGIALETFSGPEGPGWTMQGGLLARIKTPRATVELFGRETSRIHGAIFGWGSMEGRDFEYDFFLLVRPLTADVARVVARWHFAPETLALSGDPIDQSLLGRSTRGRAIIESFLHPTPGAMRQHLVDGFLDFDPGFGVATVSISGLKQPFREVIDLSADLAR